RWDERSEGRLSRSVLWEPGGEIPPGHPAARVLRMALRAALDRDLPRQRPGTCREDGGEAEAFAAHASRSRPARPNPCQGGPAPPGGPLTQRSAHVHQDVTVQGKRG